MMVMLRLFLLMLALLCSGFSSALANPAGSVNSAVVRVPNEALQASLAEFFAAQPMAHGAIAELVAVQRWPKVQGTVRWSLPKLRYLPKRVSLIAEQGQGKTLRRWYVAVSVKWMADVVTLNEDISARAVLVRSMLTKERKNIAGLRGDVWSELSDVEGLKSMRSMRRGEVVSSSKVQRPPLIQRGDHVTILVEVGGLKVRVEGKALKSGNRGDRMLVRNIRSKQMLQSTVKDAHTVAVFLGGV